MVVYYKDSNNRWSNTQDGMIQQGAQVKEGQKMLRIPDLKKMQVNTKIHEALIARIRGDDRQSTGFLDALRVAEDAGLDLVEIAPNSTPPVCKILDYGKFRFLEQKKAAEARKKQKTVEVKEIKLRPGIDDHDYDVKMRAMNKFIEEGDKVKVTMRFRGRELAHQDIGMNVLMRVRDDLDAIAKVEQMPRMEGRQMVMVMAPR